MVARRGFLKALGIGAAAPVVLPAATAAAATESMLGIGGTAGSMYGGASLAEAVVKQIPWYQDPIGLGKAALKRKWIAATMPEWFYSNKTYDDRHDRSKASVECMRSWSTSTKARVLNDRRKKLDLDDWVKSPSRRLARKLVEDAHKDMGVDDGTPWED